MEPFDLEVNKDTELRFESDGSAILTETGRVSKLADAYDQMEILTHMLKQAARQTRCLHCKQDIVLTSKEDTIIIDLFVRTQTR
jgi:hypothetical protein